MSSHVEQNLNNHTNNRSESFGEDVLESPKAPKNKVGKFVGNALSFGLTYYLKSPHRIDVGDWWGVTKSRVVFSYQGKKEQVRSTAQIVFEATKRK